MQARRSRQIGGIHVHVRQPQFPPPFPVPGAPHPGAGPNLFPRPPLPPPPPPSPFHPSKPLPPGGLADLPFRASKDSGNDDDNGNNGKGNGNGNSNGNSGGSGSNNGNNNNNKNGGDDDSKDQKNSGSDDDKGGKSGSDSGSDDGKSKSDDQNKSGSGSDSGSGNGSNNSGSSSGNGNGPGSGAGTVNDSPSNNNSNNGPGGAGSDSGSDTSSGGGSAHETGSVSPPNTATSTPESEHASSLSAVLSTTTSAPAIESTLPPVHLHKGSRISPGVAAVLGAILSFILVGGIICVLYFFIRRRRRRLENAPRPVSEHGPRDSGVSAGWDFDSERVLSRPSFPSVAWTVPGTLTLASSEVLPSFLREDHDAPLPPLPAQPNPNPFRSGDDTAEGDPFASPVGRYSGSMAERTRV